MVKWKVRADYVVRFLTLLIGRIEWVKVKVQVEKGTVVPVLNSVPPNEDAFIV
jgi:hypothetical protein